MKIFYYPTSWFVASHVKIERSASARQKIDVTLARAPIELSNSSNSTVRHESNRIELYFCSSNSTRIEFESVV
jgi:hypothetical protein